MVEYLKSVASGGGNVPKNTAALWDKNWIQGYESAWGITEKFKLANVLTGNEFLLVVGNDVIQRKKIISNNSNGFRELITMKYLSTTKIHKYFGIDLKKYNETCIIHNQMKTLNSSQVYSF